MNDTNSLSHTKWNCKYHIVLPIVISITQGFTSILKANSKNTVQLEEDKNRRGRSLPGPCAYVGRDTSKGGDIKLHGISQREKQSDDL